MSQRKRTRPYDVHAALELASWLAFPEVRSWQPFFPSLEVSLPESSRYSAQVPVRVRTDSLAEAIVNLHRWSGLGLLYRAVPDQKQERDRFPMTSSRRPGHYELDWSLTKPSGAGPRKVVRPQRSRLWSEQRQKLGNFALYHSPRTRSMHLLIHNDSFSADRHTWTTVARWIRRLHQLLLRDQPMPLEVDVPDRPLRDQQSEARALREAVRAAMVDAASQEQGPFGLRGRRHEPRVSLSRGLAATLRGIDLPCSSNHGAGNRRYFPRRVLERAGRLLQERLHRAVLCCDHDRARLKGEA